MKKNTFNYEFNELFKNKDFVTMIKNFDYKYFTFNKKLIVFLVKYKLKFLLKIIYKIYSIR